MLRAFSANPPTLLTRSESAHLKSPYSLNRGALDHTPIETRGFAEAGLGTEEQEQRKLLTSLWRVTEMFALGCRVLICGGRLPWKAGRMPRKK